jgi:hypothetical protein
MLIYDLLVCTITPMSTFAQNNGVIALTRCANRKAGYACCFWLIVMGIFSKFAAALVAIPSAVLGGMTTFLFSAVAVSGVRIISTMVCFFVKLSDTHPNLSYSPSLAATDSSLPLECLSVLVQRKYPDPTTLFKITKCGQDSFQPGSAMFSHTLEITTH